MVTPLVALLALGGCNPPIDVNTAPVLAFLSPDALSDVNEGVPFTVTFRATDAEGGVLTLVLEDGDGTVVAEVGDLSSGDERDVDVVLAGMGNARLVGRLTDDRGATGNAQLDLLLNGAPNTPGLVITPSGPNTLDDISADIAENVVDPEGQPIIYSWTWQKQGETGVFAGNALPAVLGASDTEKGDVWVFTLDISESDNGTSPAPGGITITVEAEVPIGNVPPDRPEVVVVPTQPNAVQTLQCVIATEGADVDGDPLTYTYEWEKDGTVEAITGPVVGGDLTSPGETWTCNATPNDGTDDGSTGKNDVVIADREVPVGDSPVQYYGDRAGLRVGSAAVGLSMESREGDDLILGVAPSSTYASNGGMVVVIRGGSLPGGSLEARTMAITGFNNAHLGGTLERVPSVDGSTSADLLIGIDGTTGLVDPSVILAFGDSLVPPQNLDYPYAYVSGSEEAVIEGYDLVEFDGNGELGWGAAMAGGDVDGDDLAEIFITNYRASGTSGVYLFTPNDIGAASPATGFQPRQVDPNDADGILSNQVGDGFGLGVDSDGDIDGDGAGDLVIGAPGRGTGNVAWVFTSADLAGLLETGGIIDPGDASLAFDLPTATASAGEQVKILPDINADGYAEIAIASPETLLSGDEVGMVAIKLGGASLAGEFDLDSSGTDIQLYGRDDGGRFGARLVVVGDLTGDGFAELAVAAPLEDIDTTGNGTADRTDAGAVHVFTGADLLSAFGAGGGLTAEEAAVTLYGDGADAMLTIPGPAGDLDLDGVIDLLAASPTDTDTLSEQGRLFVFLSGQ